MADDELTVVRADGATKTLRSRDVGSAVQSQKIDASPWQPTAVGTSQYSLDVGTGSVVTLTVPSGATHVFLTVEDNDVRMTENGDTPTTGANGNGLILPSGFIGELALVIVSGSTQATKLIGVSGTSEINATYRRYV